MRELIFCLIECALAVVLLGCSHPDDVRYGAVALGIGMVAGVHACRFAIWLAQSRGRWPAASDQDGKPERDLLLRDGPE
jgi:hypothetical protein